MANEEHLRVLKEGADAWNIYREQKLKIDQPKLSHANLRGANLVGSNLIWADLTEANLSYSKLMGTKLRGAWLYQAYLTAADLTGADLTGGDLSGAHLINASFAEANLTEANLSGADLRTANLRKATLTRANLIGAKLTRTQLQEADLTEADLSNADLSEANFTGANLKSANLSRATLIETNLENSNLTGCNIFGISAWKVHLDGANQANLIITDYDESAVTVDNLEVAQFIYLLLTNAKIRNVINTVANKAVLILGRFADKQRKSVLDAMQKKLRRLGYLPIIFDFERATERDFTETIKILAGLSLFVIVDMTSPRSNPLELQATIPDYMIPFVPIIQKGEKPFAMFVDLQRKYHWVMDARTYDDKKHLLDNFERGIVRPALELHRQLLIEKNEALKSKPIDEF